jgi:MIP family channel proteins
MDSPSLSLRLAAEALGTFFFFFLGFNAVAAATDLGATSTLSVAFAFGLGLALAITALGHVSGGHFNPAVSLGLAAARRFPSKEVIPYWIAQLAGGLVAVLAVAAVYSAHAVHALATAPNPRIGSGGAFILEFIVTALFVMVVTTVTTDERAPWQGVMAPLLIGLFIFAAADAVGPASGGSFNPARSLAPALYNLSFAHVWIYLVAPLSGGVLGGAIRAVFGPLPHGRPRRPARSGVLSEPRDGRDNRSTHSAVIPRSPHIPG